MKKILVLVLLASSKAYAIDIVNGGSGSSFNGGTITNALTVNGAFQANSASINSGNLPNGAIVLSSGLFVAQSTATDGATPIIQGLSATQSQVFLLQQSGVVTVSSGVKYADGSISTTAALGSSGGGATFTGGDGVTSSTTFHSTVTFQYGFATFPGTATVVPSGLLYFQSSFTVVGATYSIGGAGAVIYSTWAATIDTWNNIGDRVIVECVYDTTGTTTGGEQDVYNPDLNGGSVNNAIVYSNLNDASANFIIQAEITLIAPNQVLYFPKCWDEKKGNGAGGNTTLGACSNFTSMDVNFTTHASHIFNCRSSQTTGYQYFNWMRVWKL